MIPSPRYSMQLFVVIVRRRENRATGRIVSVLCRITDVLVFVMYRTEGVPYRIRSVRQFLRHAIVENFLLVVEFLIVARACYRFLAFTYL